MKKILIAGGAGYIGTLLTHELLKRKYHVTVVDSFWFGNYLPKQVKIINKSIIDLAEDEIKQHDVVIFMAGVSNDPMADYSPSMNFVENCAVPSYLAYMSKRCGVKRFIYASTSSVYGVSDQPNVTEEHPLVPLTLYNKYKGISQNTIFFS